MTKKEKDGVRRCVGRAEIMSRLNTLADIVGQVCEIAKEHYSQELIPVLQKITDAIKDAEKITEVWIAEYIQLTK